MNEWMNEWMNQSINQSINQSMLTIRSDKHMNLYGSISIARSAASLALSGHPRCWRRLPFNPKTWRRWSNYIKTNRFEKFGCEDVGATRTASSHFASFIHLPNMISLSSPIKVGLAPRQVTMPFPCLCSIRGDMGTGHQKELLKSLQI